MKTTEPNTKPFDAVKMMRAIRDRIDRDIDGMSFKQEKNYFKKGAQKLKRQISSDSSKV